MSRLLHLPRQCPPYKDYEEYRQALLEILYENDEFTDDHFTSGACHLFARALHEATGYPIVAIKHQSKKSWSHMGVRAPDGRFWDVSGPYPKDSGVLDDWTGSHTHVPEGEGVLKELDAEEYAYLTEGVDGPHDYVMDPAPAVGVIKRAMQLIPVPPKY